MGWRPYKDKYQRRMEELCRWMDRGAKKAAREAERRWKAQARREASEARKAARSQARSHRSRKSPTASPAQTWSGCAPSCLGVVAVVLLVPFAIATVASFFATVASAPFEDSSRSAESSTSAGGPMVPKRNDPVDTASGTAAVGAVTAKDKVETDAQSDPRESELGLGSSSKEALDGELLRAVENSARLNSQVRTWTDSSGKYTVQAEFVSFENGQVELRKRDGNVISIALSVLCPADRQHVQDRSGIKYENKPMSGRVTAVSQKQPGVCEIQFARPVEAFEGQAVELYRNGGRIGIVRVVAIRGEYIVTANAMLRPRVGDEARIRGGPPVGSSP